MYACGGEVCACCGLCVLAVVLCVLVVVRWGEKVCVCMMVLGSANVAEVKWVDSCGGEMSWIAVVKGGWKTVWVAVERCGRRWKALVEVVVDWGGWLL